MSPSAGLSRPAGRAAEALVACATVLGATVLVTWPQARDLSHTFAAHVDSYFSTWRLMWTAHALATDPLHLFDTNIFFPEKATLAYSDATLLQGLLAAPFLMAGVSPILLYNLLLLLGFAGSGLAMFVLAKRVTGSVPGALVSAVIFTMAPYRIEHFMHLELQWAMWMPLAWWAVLRVFDTGTWRDGLAAGVFLWLQFLSCVYYGVFLSMTVVALVVLLFLRSPRDGVRALPALVAGAIVGALLTFPYALPYIGNTRTLGTRDLDEIVRYSAQPFSYLAAPGESRLWGWTSERWGQPELRLFPGLVALLLAAWALRPQGLRAAWIYLALTVVTVELSFGLNGTVYGWLSSHVTGLRGLRAPARFGILVQCAIALLSGLGAAALFERWTGRTHWKRAAAVVLLIAVVAAEYANRPLNLDRVDAPVAETPDVYRMIRQLGPGVLIELPLPTLSTLPGNEAQYAFWSAAHWYPLVNGYSGYYPHVYQETLNRMETFPDDASLQRLGRLDVRYIVVHHALIEEAPRQQLLRAMGAHPALESHGQYRDPIGTASLFVLRH